MGKHVRCAEIVTFENCTIIRTYARVEQIKAVKLKSLYQVIKTCLVNRRFSRFVNRNKASYPTKLTEMFISATQFCCATHVSLCPLRRFRKAGAFSRNVRLVTLGLKPCNNRCSCPTLLTLSRPLDHATETLTRR